MPDSFKPQPAPPTEDDPYGIEMVITLQDADAPAAMPASAGPAEAHHAPMATLRLDRLHLPRLWSRQPSAQTTFHHLSSAVSPSASWLKSHDEVVATTNRFGTLSWQAAVVRAIHNPMVQVLFSVLLMVDVLAVVTELFLEAQYPECHIIRRDAVSCCEVGHPELPHDLVRRLGGHGRHDGVCGGGLQATQEWPADCEPHKWPAAHLVHRICSGITLGVLGIFLLELLLLVAVWRLAFFRKKLYMLDLTIVVGTLGLELFHYMSWVSEYDPAKVMILSRCWRFLRVGHGLVVETHERQERELNDVRRHCQEMVQKIRGLQTQLEARHRAGR